MTPEGIPDYHGNVQPSSIEQAVFEKSLYAQRMTEIPSNMQMRIEYDPSYNPIYVGYGARGLAESGQGWVIHKNSFDTANNMVKRQIAYDSWENRLTATYE